MTIPTGSPPDPERTAMSETVKLPPLPNPDEAMDFAPKAKVYPASIVREREALWAAHVRAALASAPAGEPIPEGWTLKRHEDGVIGVWKEDVGGYAANREDDTIASAILWELANDLLSTPAAPPAGAGASTVVDHISPEVRDNAACVESVSHNAAPVHQPQPVATVYLGSQHTRDGFRIEWHTELPDGVHSLYAHQPQPVATVDEREPLTEEEIREVVTAEGLQFTAPDIRVARAVERAHGIAAHHPHREDEGEAPDAGVSVLRSETFSSDASRTASKETR
jgi:hypothetical protein